MIMKIRQRSLRLIRKGYKENGKNLQKSCLHIYGFMDCRFAGYADLQGSGEKSGISAAVCGAGNHTPDLVSYGKKRKTVK